jgi:hypothetical protein
MAYVQTPEDPNAPGATAAPAAGAAQPPQTATGTGGSAGVTPGSPQGTTAIPATTQAPPVQDLHAYLEANAPQAVGMGQNIAGNLNTQYETVAGDINSAQSAQDAAIHAGTVEPNTDLVSRAAADPNAFVQNPDDLGAFLAQRDAAYTGPTSFESTPDYTKSNAAVNKAVSSAPDINKPGGVQQLVTGQETNPTMGMSNLDTLILQETPDAMAPIQGVIPKFQTLAPQLETAATEENAAITKAAADAAAAKQGVQDSFLTGPNAVAPAFQKSVAGELTANEAKTNAYNDALATLINEENKAQPDYAALENAVKDYNAALQIDLSMIPAGNAGRPNTASILTMGDKANPTNLAEPTLAQSATPEDIAYQNALESLLGSGYTPSFDASGVKPFTEPGNPPTVQDIFNPSLAPLSSSIPNLSNDVGYVPGVNYAGNVRDAYSKLLAYLEESNPNPPTPTKPENPNTPIGFGNGRTYVDPIDGKTKTVY